MVTVVEDAIDGADITAKKGVELSDVSVVGVIGSPLIAAPQSHATLENKTLGAVIGVGAALRNIQIAYKKQKASLDELAEDPRYKTRRFDYEGDED